MKFVLFSKEGETALGALRGEDLFTAPSAHGQQNILRQLLAEGEEALKNEHRRLLSGIEVDQSTIQFLPPFPTPEKILCAGLNYKDHAAESGLKVPDYPMLFGRFASSLIGHRTPIVRPSVSDQLDYEGELVAIIGRAGKNIPVERALEHVAGYSVFNDASIRDYQMKTPQWTIGKNFDATGAFGPYFVTADEVPSGAKGLRLETRLNGTALQNASTADMIFDVATQVSLISEAMMLRPGDIIVTGTPSGVGLARTPKLFMKPGDVCEVEIEGIGLLSNTIAQQSF